MIGRGITTKEEQKKESRYKPCSAKMCDGYGYLFAKYKNPKIGMGAAFRCPCRKFEPSNLPVWEKGKFPGYVLEPSRYGYKSEIRNPKNYQDKD